MNNNISTIQNIFFSEFATLAAAPGGIAKLRELILQFAVQGKLAPQNPEEEPASVLLERIKAEKVRLVIEGKIKKSKPLPPIVKEEVPFEVPQVWVWCRLGDITEKIGSGSTPKGGKSVYQDSGIKFFRSQNVWNNGIKTENIAYISNEIHEKMSGTTVFPKDILLNITGASIGRCSLVPDDFEVANVSQHVSILRTVEKNIRKFLHLTIISSYFQKIIMDQQVGISREGLSKKQLELFYIPLPPLAEQHRIVEKVDALMTLCDELAARQMKQREMQAKLGVAALALLTEADDATAFADSWARICDEFDLIFDTVENITAFRQAILQLAVQGKLVPQNPEDEPAHVLLERIKAEKARLVKEGKIKKSKALPPVAEDEVPFEVPKGWMWVKLDSICTFITDGTHYTPTYTSSGVPFLSVKDVSSGIINFTNTKYISKSEHIGFKNRCNPEFEDILLTKVGTTGIAKVIDVSFEFSIFVSLALLKVPKKMVYPYYLELALNSPLGKEQSRENTQGVGNKNLVLRLIKNFNIPIPPLAEQYRIVEKVDAIMLLCDELEHRIQKREETQTKLLESVVAQITA